MVIRFSMQYLVPIMAIFQGRVIDMPEAKMAETKYSTGGEVEHEVNPLFPLLVTIH